MSGARHRAREAALQILYFHEVGRADVDASVAAYFVEHQPDAPDAVRRFATRLVEGTVAETAAIDPIIGRHARHWRVERLAVIDRLILRLAVFELEHEPKTPPAVVVDEAIELARRFSGDEAGRFVNGVLDAVVRDPARGPAPAR